MTRLKHTGRLKYWSTVALFSGGLLQLTILSSTFDCPQTVYKKQAIHWEWTFICQVVIAEAHRQSRGSALRRKWPIFVGSAYGTKYRFQMLASPWWNGYPSISLLTTRIAGSLGRLRLHCSWAPLQQTSQRRVCLVWQALTAQGIAQSLSYHPFYKQIFFMWLWLCKR
jgi:hypothetical protein